MSVGHSNVMFSSSSSSSSSSSATKVGSLIETFNKTNIKSCVIGISKLKFHWLYKNISHTAILLSNKKRSQLEKDRKSEGIIIEYGNYPPDEEKARKKEENYIENGHVIYRYGKQKGGIRYYTNTLKEFIDKFCDVGYIMLRIKKDNEMTFAYFIDIIAPLNENIWVKEKYNAIGFFNKTVNCQTFTSHCIDVMKPDYEIRCITKGKDSESISEDKKEVIVPDDVLETLQKYED